MVFTLSPNELLVVLPLDDDLALEVFLFLLHERLVEVNLTLLLFELH